MDQMIEIRCTSFNVEISFFCHLKYCKIFRSFLDFFWLSRINQGAVSDIFRNKLLLANQSQAVYVQESLHLISLLDQYHSNIYELTQRLPTLKVPFIGPFGLIEKFDHDITVKNSATRPIIIRYYTNGIKRAFLYKREDIRKDAHIVSLIHIMYYLCSDILIRLTARFKASCARFASILFCWSSSLFSARALAV